MNIKEKFLQLTSYTHPYGTEEHVFQYLPKNLETDEFGNRYIIIGDNPTTMFTSHLDTACSTHEKVTHRIKENIIRTDRSTILGADCKAGVAIMLYMIEQEVNGLYYFFLGEECGCMGSRWLSKEMANNNIFSDLELKRCISFDRYGHNSFITHQMGSQCCSDDFSEFMINEFNNTEYDIKFKKDPHGIYTDSAQFTEIIPECTNISVGYNGHHSHNEYQDIEFLERISKACCEVDWDNSPVERDPKKRYSYYDNFIDSENIKNKKADNEIGVIDIDFNDQHMKVKLTKERLNKEIEWIIELLFSWGIDVTDDEILWTGDELLVDGFSEIISREELIRYDGRFLNLKIEEIDTIIEESN